MIVLLVRRYWPHVVEWWDKAKEGGAILGRRGAFFGRVFLPSFISWCAGLAVIGVFLNAYGIPVSFDTLMHVAGGNSLANVTSVTPGGVGVTQAWNVASLKGVASSTRRDRLLRRAAARVDGVVHPLRADPHDLGLGVGRRQAARHRLVRRGEAPPGEEQADSGAPRRRRRRSRGADQAAP